MAKNTLTLKNAPKATGKVKDDTVEIANELAKNEPSAAEVIAEAIKNPAPSDPDKRIAQAQTAASKLGEFRLTPLALSFLDKALVNVSENTGRGIEDPVARDKVETMAGIVEASGHDLHTALNFVVEAMPDDSTSFVYQLCYTVQKALNFIGNMAYRRALDPKSDFDLEKYIDQREEHVEPPVGLGSDNHDVAFDAEGNRIGNVAGGEERQTDYEQILDALDTVHIYLQLITETFGWDPEMPMPFMVVRDPIDESYSQIMDCEACLDLMEVRYKEARAKRQAKQLEGLKKIRALALASLKKAASK